MDWNDAGEYLKPSRPSKFNFFNSGTIIAPAKNGYIIARDAHAIDMQISQTPSWNPGSYRNIQANFRPMPVEISLNFVVPESNYTFIPSMPKMVENMTILELLEEVDKRLKESKL